MSSANSNKSNGGPNRDGHGGWGCRKGSSQGQNGGGVDQTAWRALDKPYRKWLVSRGLAVDAAAFNALSFEQKLKAAEIAAVARTAEHSELFWYNRDRGRGG
jgi:hypothetical protein